jgi:hypothetical protein
MPLGAPHYHMYKSSENDFKVEVFCTPRHKTYHFFYDEGVEIKGCSKTFIEETCLAFEIDDFFDDEKFQRTIEINDRKFHKLFEVDTLKIKISGSKKTFSLLPIN